MTTSIDQNTLVTQYTPYLVLYPEINDDHLRPNLEESNYPHDSVLDRDYYPRDIKMVLDHSAFYRKGWQTWRRRPMPPGWSELLNQMEKKKYKGDLDVFPKISRSDKRSFWSEYGKIAGKDERYEPTCYARMARGNSLGRDLLVIQYWYPYLYNDFWNVHEMDWETVMVVLEGGGQNRPLLCAYSAHEGGHWLPWREVDKVNDESVPADTGTHPIVYVASGSHANYFTGPAIFRTAPPVLKLVTQIIGKPLAKLFPNSELSKLLNQVRQPLDYTASLDQVGGLMVNAKIIPDRVNGAWEGEWRWLNHTGRWGSPGEWIGLGDAGPLGPPHTGIKWEDPLWWIDADCTRSPAKETANVPTRSAP